MNIKLMENLSVGDRQSNTNKFLQLTRQVYQTLVVQLISVIIGRKADF